MNKYMLIVTPFRGFVRENFKDRVVDIDIPVARFWQSRLVVVEVPNPISLEDIQLAVAAPGRHERHIESFRYHSDPDVTAYCNEEFLYFDMLTWYPGNWLIRKGDEYGICGSIALLSGIDECSDTPGFTKASLEDLLLKYFCDDNLESLWPESAKHRVCIGNIDRDDERVCRLLQAIEQARR